MLEKLNLYTQDDVNAMTEEQFMEYVRLSIDLGNRWMEIGRLDRVPDCCLRLILSRSF
jgi:hypothetical protein